MNIFKYFFIALTFFTRIPIFIKNVTEDEFYKSMVLIPIVGSVIGIFLFILIIIIKFIDYIPLESFLLLFFYIYITGGLHLDGLADTADALLSGRKQEEIFKIMKDSRLGTFGALSLILIVLAYYICFSYLIENNELLLFILFPIIGRFCAIELGCFSKPAPESGGLAKGFCKYLKKPFYFLYLLILILFIYYIYNIRILLVFIIINVVTFIEIFYFKKRISSITGDQVGMIIETNQILFLILIIILKF